MVSVTTDLYRVALHIFTNTTDIVVEIVFDLAVNQIFSVLCTENDMRVYFRERLWHNNILCLDYALTGLPFVIGIWHSAWHYVTDAAPLGQEHQQ